MFHLVYELMLVVTLSLETYCFEIDIKTWQTSSCSTFSIEIPLHGHFVLRQFVWWTPHPAELRPVHLAHDLHTSQVL